MDEILREFDRQADGLRALVPAIEELLAERLAENAIQVHSVIAGVKSRQSLERKIQAHVPPYAALADITDVLRARIITYLRDDVDVVGRLIEQEFTIDRDNSRDPRVTTDPRQFGYRSLHYVVTLAPARAALPGWQQLGGRSIEIQVRTILQHAWAEIEHDRGFHTADDVPRDVRRRWSRVAALLETADDEFEELRRSSERDSEVGSTAPRPQVPIPLRDPIETVAVGTVGSLARGELSSRPFSISIVVAPPRGISGSLRIALETPDVTFAGNPLVGSHARVKARLVTNRRVIEIDAVVGAPSIVILGVHLDVGASASPGPIQASISLNGGPRRAVAPLGQIRYGPDLVVVVPSTPTLRANARNQTAGRVSITETAGGSLVHDEVLRLRLVDMADVSRAGATFEVPPVLVVKHGDIRFRDRSGPSVSNTIEGIVDPSDPSRVEWMTWTASTQASSLEIGAAGSPIGPIISVGPSLSAIGVVVETDDRNGEVTLRSLSVLGHLVSDG